MRDRMAPLHLRKSSSIIIYVYIERLTNETILCVSWWRTSFLPMQMSTLSVFQNFRVLENLHIIDFRK